MEEDIEKTNIDINLGLDDTQVKSRYEDGKVNFDTSIPTKSIKSIVVGNVFTLFNIMNIILGIAIMLVGSYKNMLFLGVAICNTIISIAQELHSKKIVDKLSVIASTKAHAIRNGKKIDIGINEIVIDDVLELETGNQIVTDATIKSGEIEVNESFITGEADTIIKKVGDELLSGSFVISGRCIAQVEHVGIDNYTSRISGEAKYIKKVRSELMVSLNRIIKFISIAIVPIGILLFINQLNLDGNDINNAVVNTVAAIIGMIPEGLVLLTSTVLAVSVIRLAKSKVLVQELYCIENLARVDTLCLDKTGTITEGKMEVKQVVSIGNNNIEEIEKIITAIGKYSEDKNATIEAIRDKYIDDVEFNVKEKIAFSSQKKWSGISFENEGSYIIGSPEFILKDNIDKYKQEIDKYIEDYRVIALAHSDNDFNEKELPKDINLIALILIVDKIRSNAKQTLEYFKEQGVDIKIISGDNPITVSKIARRAGVENYDKYIDCTKLKSYEDIKDAVDKYTIFGRVSPSQKKELVIALKANNHTVAMTGDGVNDVLALKEADCSIAVASGSDAARNVSQLILLDSDFSSMPKVVAEGRRTINNIQRSAILFLIKTIYAAVLAIIFVFVSMPYPFIPIQLTLISVVTIGIPSFILALEPNKERVKGHFISNVIGKSLASAMSIISIVIVIAVVSHMYNIPVEVYATLCVLMTVVVGILSLIKICIPFNVIRCMLVICMIALFIFGITILAPLFSIVLSNDMTILITILAILSVSFFFIFNFITAKLWKVKK